MGGACIRSAGASGVAAALGAVTALSACAPSPGEIDGAPAALFKVRMGGVGGSVAPGPHSYWYVQRQPVSFEKIGVATYRVRATHGLRAWISRLLDRYPAHEPAEPTAVAAAALGLPVPARVEVTNLVTGAALTVRVEDKAPLTYGILRLSAAAAHGLGAEPGRSLLVRVRYLAPVMTYNAQPTLRYALRGAPAAPSPPRVAPGAAAVAQAPLPSPAIVTPAVIRLAPASPISLQKVALALRPELSPPPAGANARLQIGAFARLANARRAVDMLKPAGAAAIEPTHRGGLVLYRVTLPAPGDAREVDRLRARMAQMGFGDARLIQPL